MEHRDRAHTVRWASLAVLASTVGSCSESHSRETAFDTGTQRERAALGSEVAVAPRVWTQKATLRASDGVVNDYFGQVLAAQGNTLVVGGEGLGPIPSSVYAFTGSGANWTEQEKLVPPEASDSFGGSLAVSGDTILVGAPGEASGTVQRVGAAYVFVRSGSDWTFQQKLTAPTGGSFDEFGRALAIDGDTAVISAPGEYTSNGATGAAYVFVRSGTTWTPQQKLRSHFIAETNQFGASLAIAGDEIMVGAPSSARPGLNAGAYAFTRSGGTWTYYYFFSSLLVNATPGRYVAMDNETAVLGYASRGVVQYTREDDWWWEQDDHDFLRPIGPIALSGDVLAIGAPSTTAPTVLSGTVYVQIRNGTSWELTPPLVPSPWAGGYGMSVAATGGTVFAGGMPSGEPGWVHVFTEGAGGSAGAGGAGGAGAGAGGAGGGGPGGVAGGGNAGVAGSAGNGAGTGGVAGSGAAGGGAGAGGLGGNGAAGGSTAGEAGAGGEAGEGGAAGAGGDSEPGGAAGASSGSSGASGAAGTVGSAGSGGVGAGGVVAGAAGRDGSQPGSGSPDESGCGCRVARASDRRAHGLLALLAPLLMLVRRRRRTAA